MDGPSPVAGGWDERERVGQRRTTRNTSSAGPVRATGVLERPIGIGGGTPAVGSETGPITTPLAMGGSNSDCTFQTSYSTPAPSTDSRSAATSGCEPALSK